MLELKLAYKNLIRAGLRTWLNVAVLSFIYVLIIWHQGLFMGMLEQSTHEVIKDEIAGGQYWHKTYDPYDPISLDDSHGIIPPELEALIQKKEAVPILIRQATIYPEGRIQSILLKGIVPEQKVLEIPSDKLKTEEDILPLLIGKRMAESNSLNIGDYITIRWRDAYGTFDAVEGKIVEIMRTYVPTIDSGQLWVPLEKLQEMTLLQNEATMIVVSQTLSEQADLPDWLFKDHDFLLKDVYEMIRTKRVSGGILYAILLFLAMLAIFDTQVLAIFKRRKEIGTLMALGMTRLKVILLFTFEGAMHGILAVAVGAVYGLPLMILTAKKGLPIPQSSEDYGFAIMDKIFPAYPIALVLGTVLIVMLTVTIVSFLPTRKISKMKPTEALKGKMS